jgi:cohesin complex subunit SCC1
MCADLHNTYKAVFSHTRHSDAESGSHEQANVANVDNQDALPERHLTLKSPGNAAVQSEQVTAKSPGNAEPQPEPHLTPMSPENGDATLFDSTPELPRFSPGGNQSPLRYDDTPFKTPGGTPQSRPGGTGATEMLATYGSYASPGQSTRVSDPNGSPFPFDDELEEDLPEIPGLISTPSMISSAGTGTTGLGSMSTRTR